MKREILERIERELELPGLVERLAERIQQADLHSLLLELFHRRAEARTPAELLADWGANRFVHPSSADPRVLARFDAAAFAALPAGFAALELSPVCPLGTSSVLATVHQDKALASIRSVEVLSDATNVLALECAARRRALLRADPKSTAAVHLAASHRHLRTQALPGPLFFAHFRLFVLCSAGRDGREGAFARRALDAHLGFYARITRELLGPEFAVRVALTDLTSSEPRGIVAARAARRRVRVRPVPHVRPRILHRSVFQDPRAPGLRRVARARRRRRRRLEREAAQQRQGTPLHQRHLQRTPVLSDSVIASPRCRPTSRTGRSTECACSTCRG